MTRPDRSLPLRQAPPLHLVACDQVNDRTNERPVSISRSKPGPGPARPGGGFLLLVLSFGSPFAGPDQPETLPGNEGEAAVNVRPERPARGA